MRSANPGRTATMLATIALSVAAPVIVTTAGGSAAAQVQTAQVQTAAACSSTKKGVTEVVDFTKLGGKVQTACDPSNPKTGLTALTGAGFTYSFVPRLPGFICRIDKLPNPCNGAPSTAYWSYWHAQPHGTWVYSKTGAGSYHPKPGSVEGWAFGAGQAPGISPP
jgi:hypothetical protein